ncbi:MAG: pilus assembly PilX N-terminal domain-containing protein [bacterium]
MINPDVSYKVQGVRKIHLAPCTLHLKPSRGFALLIAVIFMSVMLTLGLALGSIGYKQQTLASSAIASQYAFYAADAAMECALFADQQQNLFTYQPSPAAAPLLSCGDATIATGYPIMSRSPSQWIITTRLSYNVDNHCADVTVYKPVAGTTYIFSQGYDVACSSIGTNTRYASRGISSHY